jgi:hypothetical protein
MKGAPYIITVWNKWRNPATNKDEWFRHVIPNCSWERKAVRAVSGQTASIASVFGVLLPQSELFKPEREWALGDKAAFFTLKPGDIIALGEQTAEITGVSPYTESAVRQSLAPEVFTISIASDNTAKYKRGKHYYAEGV